MRACVLISAALAGLAACGGGGGGSGKTLLPTLTWSAGDAYFTVGGVKRPILTRNITGESKSEILGFLDQAAAAGVTLVRMHVMQGLGQGARPDGTLDPTWAAGWDEILSHARARRLYVMPVLGVWADWNDTNPDFQNWHNNPFNTANGGTVSSPGQLWADGSAARALWLGWVQQVVERWQDRDNIALWETFSELDLVSGATAARAASLAGAAAAVVRGADARHRPVTASLALAFYGWQAADYYGALWSGTGADVLQIHHYVAPLDTALIGAVQRARALGKPVMLGETGLDAAFPAAGSATVEEHAARRVRHAIWAGLTSGAMNARALWWEDSYAIYATAGVDGRALVASYARAEAPAVAFADAVDFGPMLPGTPLALTSTGLVGGASGSAAGLVGWARATACEAPTWGCGTVKGATVQIAVSCAQGSTWSVTYYSTATGTPFSRFVDAGGGESAVPPPMACVGDELTLQLTQLDDDLAFVAVPAS
jgi:hypothetical protein